MYKVNIFFDIFCQNANVSPFLTRKREMHSKRKKKQIIMIIRYLYSHLAGTIRVPDQMNMMGGRTNSMEVHTSLMEARTRQMEIRRNLAEDHTNFAVVHMNLVIRNFYQVVRKNYNYYNRVRKMAVHKMTLQLMVNKNLRERMKSFHRRRLWKSFPRFLEIQKVYSA